MSGPVRPQTMQTTAPLTTSATPAASGKCGSGRVENAIRPCEDWSVTPASWQARRRRYSLWRSAWSWRPNSLCWCRRFEARRLSIRAQRRQRGPQYRCPR
jgi:hypothetical protein